MYALKCVYRWGYVLDHVEKAYSASHITILTIALYCRNLWISLENSENFFSRTLWPPCLTLTLTLVERKCGDWVNVCRTLQLLDYVTFGLSNFWIVIELPPLPLDFSADFFYNFRWPTKIGWCPDYLDFMYTKKFGRNLADKW